MRGWLTMAEEALALLRDIRDELKKLNESKQKSGGDRIYDGGVFR